MKGTRPLTTDEIIAVSQQFDGDFAIRNRSLFMLGVSVGGRISELLSLTIGDVWQNGQAVGDLLFGKDIVKGKETARMVPVNQDGKDAITELLRWHIERYKTIEEQRPLFPSRKHGQAISRVQAHRLLEDAFQKAGLNGKLATHSMRKTYAQRMYDATGDIYLVKEMLGHKDVKTTQTYLGVSYAKAQAASKAIELRSSKSSVYVTRGMLRFIQNDDELAIIIAHEMAHAVRGHVSEKLAKEIGAAFLGGCLAGLTGIKGTADLATQMVLLATLEFDRDAEREADVYGLTYASRAGYDIRAAVDLWERFAIEMPESYIALTHPPSPERFVRAKKIVAMLQSGGDPIKEFAQENTQSSLKRR